MNKTYSLKCFGVNGFFFAQDVGGGLDKEDGVETSLQGQVLEPGTAEREFQIRSKICKFELVHVKHICFLDIISKSTNTGPRSAARFNKIFFTFKCKGLRSSVGSVMD